MNEVTTKEQLTLALQQADVVVVSGALALQLRVLVNKEAPLSLPVPNETHRMAISDAVNYAQKSGVTMRSALHLVRYVGVSNVIRVLRYYTVALRKADGTELILRKK